MDDAATRSFYFTLTVGPALMIVGPLMMWAHVKTWRRQQLDTSPGSQQRRHLFVRYRRRMQTSAMIALLGLGLAAGDLLIWGHGPIVTLVYWLAFTGVALWVLLLGIGDLASVRVDTRGLRDELKRLDQKKLELEGEFGRLNRPRSNGKDEA